MPLLGSRGSGSARGFGFQGASVPLIASGGSVTTSGDYTIHTFTSSGSFVVVADKEAIIPVEAVAELVDTEALLVLPVAVVQQRLVIP